MQPHTSIPNFTLFGETGHFPDIIHIEAFSARAPLHNWRIAPHRHGHMAQLFLIENGSGQAVVDGHAITLKSHVYLYIPANKVHSFTFQPNIEGRVISLPMSVLHSVGPASADMQTVLTQTHSGSVAPPLIKLTELLVDAFESTGAFRAQRIVGLVHSVLAVLAEQAPENAPATVDTRLEQLDALIAHHMAAAWSAADYAAALSISTGHLSRLCRAASGRSASAYIEARVMEEACRLLAFTALPVSEIGYRLGYSDPSYFSKRYRIARQQTPSEYRAQFAG